MNKIATTLSPTAGNMIRMDHTHVMLAFHKYHADTSPGIKQALIKQIILALEVHAQLEEEIFYPAVFAAKSGSDKEKSVHEHNEMRRLMDQLRDMDGADPKLDETLMELMRNVIHHVADEETILLPEAERLLGKERLSELGAEMTKRRFALLGPRAGELAGSMVRAAPAKSALVAFGTIVLAAWIVDRVLSDGRRTGQLRNYLSC